MAIIALNVGYVPEIADYLEDTKLMSNLSVYRQSFLV
jgi:hypothetical protein